MPAQTKSYLAPNVNSAVVEQLWPCTFGTPVAWGHLSEHLSAVKGFRRGCVAQRREPGRQKHSDVGLSLGMMRWLQDLEEIVSPLWSLSSPLTKWW